VSENKDFRTWFDRHRGHKLKVDRGLDEKTFKGFKCLDCARSWLMFSESFEKDPLLMQVLRELEPLTIWEHLNETE
jgi:hypothetical protein